MNSSLKEIYHQFFETQPKAFVELLELIGNYNISSVKNTINILSQKCIPVNIENIKMILGRDNSTTKSSFKQSSMQKQIVQNSKRHLSMYDKIIGTHGVEGGVAV